MLNNIEKNLNSICEELALGLDVLDVQAVKTATESVANLASAYGSIKNAQDRSDSYEANLARYEATLATYQKLLDRYEALTQDASKPVAPTSLASQLGKGE
jgi:multidrug resistance efflux pump